ncbi:Lrp/AsnC family transcriptional regulator [Streptomyces sp. NPDC048462]|uniref:Lrp/AsnC family transcriptional regulator n=1 Tax=Streptomyces sp. NPDC048462 TaxID=3365555 RepID=UPI00370FB54A
MDHVTIDATDRRIIHALQVDGRASFSRIAAVLDLGERTVARRYQRLRSCLALRVVGISDARHLGHLDWFVRMRSTPEVIESVGAALAGRQDTSWIASLAPGTELTCIIQAGPAGIDGPGTVFDQLGRRRNISSLTAQCLLAPVAGVGGWAGRLGALTSEEKTELAPEAASFNEINERFTPTPEDRRLLHLLAEDARTSIAALADLTATPESTVRRRVSEFIESGLLLFEVEIDPRLYGRTVEAICWLDVEPARLAEAGKQLSTHGEVAFAATTTGPTNVLAILELTGAAALHEYLTARLGGLEGIRHVETALTGRRSKRAGPLLVRRRGA